MSVADVAANFPLSADTEVCRDFERSSRLEWLETNHTGAYAMGTVAGVNTRRYHALLIASLKPPADRYSFLSRVEEEVSIGAETYSLATAQYPGMVAPSGYQLLNRFRIDSFPIWEYACGEAIVTKSLRLIEEQQSVFVRYASTAPCRISIRLLLSFRDYHSLTKENDAVNGSAEIQDGCVSFALYSGLPALDVFHNGYFEAEPLWYLRNEYLRDLERGLDFEEDLFSPGRLVFELGPGKDAWFVGTFEAVGATGSRGAPKSTLTRALDQFRVRRFDGKPSLLAGFPWFTDWSRDTLISLPALSIAGFPEQESRDILAMLLAERSEGLLPNRFLDAHGEPEYNTVDGTLWWFVAAHRVVQNHLENFYEAAREILAWHRRGTKYGIRVDPNDHLLQAGSAETQLTWMDAKTGGKPVTPRAGKPVEINALWYNALRIVGEWAGALGYEQDRDDLEQEAEKTRLSFGEQFWNPQLACLYDVISPEGRDESIRPNQLFALSLPFPLLDGQLARSIVEVVRRTLLTPVGLRTLAPGSPGYQARFEGNMAERDGAYHQGTVWPWLMGPFIEAYLFAFGENTQTLEFACGLVLRMTEELNACCLGSLSEVYDAEPPHRPGGCPAQLWSVAQLIMAMERVGRYPPRQ